MVTIQEFSIELRKRGFGLHEDQNGCWYMNFNSDDIAKGKDRKVLGLATLYDVPVRIKKRRTFSGGSILYNFALENTTEKFIESLIVKLVNRSDFQLLHTAPLEFEIHKNYGVFDSEVLLEVSKDIKVIETFCESKEFKMEGELIDAKHHLLLFKSILK